MKTLKHKNNRGFTLLETLIYIFIIGSIFITFVSFALAISRTRNKTYAISEVQSNGRTALGIIEQKIRMATAVISPVSGASASLLVLDMPGASPNITFSITSGTLQMAEVGNPTVTITDSKVMVSNVSFTNLAPSEERANILVQMTAAYNAPSGDTEYGYSEQLQTSVSVRQ